MFYRLVERVVHLPTLVLIYILIQYFTLAILVLLGGLFSFDPEFLERFFQFESGLLQNIDLLLLGTFSFIIGSYGKSVYTIKHVRIDWNLKNAVSFATIVYFGTIFYRFITYFVLGASINDEHYGNVLGPAWIGYLIFPSKYQIYSAIICLIAIFSNKNDFNHKRIAIAIVVLVFTAGALTRSRYAVFAPFISFLFILVIMSSKVDANRLIKVSFIIIPIIMIMKGMVRSTEVSSVDGHIGEVFHRLSMVVNFNVVVNHFDEPVWGRSIIPVLFTNLSVIPDFITNYVLEGVDPLILGGNYFGRYFGLAASTDENTGVAFPLMADLYLNFGVVGICLGMFLFGLVIRRLVHVIRHKPSCTKIFLVSILIPLFLHGQESQIGSWLAELLRIFIFFTLCKMLFVVKNTNSIRNNFNVRVIVV
jgi:oligosaccharide repeat unit polymerase